MLSRYAALLGAATLQALAAAAAAAAAAADPAADDADERPGAEEGPGDASVGLKVAAIAAVFLSAVLGGLVPLYSRRVRESDAVLGHCNSFAGGVFLSMALNHLLPEGSESLEELGTNYPAAGSITLAGYVLVLVIERTVMSMGGEGLHGHGHGGGHTGAGEYACEEGGAGAINSPRGGGAVLSPAGAAEHYLPPPLLKTELSSSSEPPPSMAISAMSAPLPLTATDNPTRERRLHSAASLLPPEEDGGDDDRATSLLEGGASSTGTAHLAHERPLAASMLLMVALCVHSTFEGVAMGVQRDADHVVSVCIAIVAHKWAAAAALATSFIRSGRNRRHALAFMAIFVLASPVGAIVGAAAAAHGSEVMIGTFTCLAAGTFLFVGANEVVAEEFESPKHRASKMAFFMVGAGAVCALSLLHDD